jgi:tape measure domain-containing protein
MTTETVVLRLELQAAALEKKLTAAERRLKGFQGKTNAISSQVRAQLTGMFAIGAIIAFGKAQVELITKIDASNRALKAITGTSLEYARAKAMLRSSAESFGVSILDLTQSYVRYIAAAKSSTLSTEELDTIFNKMTKSTAVLGLSAAETEGVLKALEQMLSKSKVQAEELRGQLGDRLPGAFAIMAKSMGITTAELDKLLKKGGVMADEVLPNFAVEYEKAVGAAQLKKVETLRSEFGRFNSAWVGLVESIDSAEGALSSFVKGATDWVVIMGGLNDDSISFWKDFMLNTKSTAEIADLVRAKYEEQRVALEKLTKENSEYITGIVDGYTDAGKSVDDFIAAQKKLIPMALSDDGIIKGDDLLAIYAEFEKRYKADVTAKKEAEDAKLKAYEDRLKKQLEAEKRFKDELAKLEDELAIQGKMAGYSLIEEIKSQAAMVPAAFAVIDSMIPSGGGMTNSEVDDFFKHSLVVPDEILEEQKRSLDASVAQADKWNDEIKEKLDIGPVLANMAVAAVDGFLDGIMSGDIKASLDALVGIIGEGMQQIGQQMLALGIAKSVIISGGPGALITGGIALMTLGKALSNASARMSSNVASGSGGGYGGQNRSFGSSGMSGQSINISGETVIRGRDLAYVFGQNDKDLRAKANF